MDEFLNPKDKDKYLKNVDYMNKRRLGLVPPRQYQFKNSHYRHLISGVCPKCKRNGPLTEDWTGQKTMCSECFKKSI